MGLDTAVTRGSRHAEPPPPRVVEIVGPPGAGKTSLLCALTEQLPAIRPIYEWRRLRWIPSFARDAAGLLPLFLGEWRIREPLVRRDMERMIRVQTSRRIAERCNATTLVMDQGPIYTLATLHLRHPGSAEDAPLEIWWQRMARQWARVLDTVIYLDARDEVLLERIRKRRKHHRLKAGADAEGLEWLASLRGELERTVESFRACSGLGMLRVDTGDEDLAGILDRVREILDCEPERSDSPESLRTRAAPRAGAAARR